MDKYIIPSTFWQVMEYHGDYRSYRSLRVLCDACCRVPESRQQIPQHKARGKSACGYILLNEVGDIVEQGAKYIGEVTIDEAEYHAVILALDRAVGFCRQNIEVWLDSEVIVSQLNGLYCLRSDRIKILFDEVKKLELRFKSVKYFHHNRGSFWARAVDKVANDEYSRIHTG